MYELMIISGSDGGDTVIAKVEKLLIEQGITNPRQELGREKLLKIPALDVARKE